MTSVRDVTTEAFAPYGRPITKPARGHDADGPGWRWWAEIDALSSGDDRPWTFGYLDLEPGALEADWAERHLRTEEVIVAGAADIIVYVAAPIAGSPDELPPVDAFSAFRVGAGEGVVLSPGVWHGAPFAIASPGTALVLLRQGTGREDVLVERFPDEPLTVEVSA